ncbi:MAG: EutN/CcmL family microcompartment protein [Planctomycetota bacterium]|nr:EutN/CcmL family microcompartment protein [Planctomycetota bacterium]
MQLAQVVGRVTSTIKHASLNGWKLLIVQPLDASRKPDGEPQLAIDPLGSRQGDTVLITSDGAAVRDLVGMNTTPLRWAIIGLPDT